jgi:hypothetical protein
MRFQVDKIIRSKRKTLCLEVTRDARLIIRAPLWTGEEVIKDFVLRKRVWIAKKLKRARNSFLASHKTFREGEFFSYLGRSYRLIAVDEPVNKVFFFDNNFFVSRSAINNVRSLFIDWYRRQAYRLIKERVLYYHALTGLDFNCFKISRAAKRWGSCTSKNNLLFNFRLVMAPLPVIDYVVVHELCHLAVRNHSRKFWDKVGKVLTDYRVCKAWLKENGYSLNI